MLYMHLFLIHQLILPDFDLSLLRQFSNRISSRKPVRRMKGIRASIIRLPLLFAITKEQGTCLPDSRAKRVQGRLSLKAVRELQELLGKRRLAYTEKQTSWQNSRKGTSAVLFLAKNYITTLRIIIIMIRAVRNPPIGIPKPLQLAVQSQYPDDSLHTHADTTSLRKGMQSMQSSKLGPMQEEQLKWQVTQRSKQGTKPGVQSQQDMLARSIDLDDPQSLRQVELLTQQQAFEGQLVHRLGLSEQVAQMARQLTQLDDMLSKQVFMGHPDTHFPGGTVLFIQQVGWQVMH